MLLYKNDALNKPILKFKEMGQHINSYVKEKQEPLVQNWNDNAQFHQEPNKHKLKQHATFNL